MKKGHKIRGKRRELKGVVDLHWSKSLISEMDVREGGSVNSRVLRVGHP
jgi:hypothetical protein